MTRGRPREFNAEQALDRALSVFWRKGYEGTSLPDLTEAMGINRPSLYAAFGNKESLFRKAMERYEKKNACRVHEALEEPDVRAGVEKLLRTNVELITDPKKPHGCFFVQGALACGEEADSLKSEMAKRRSSLEALLRKRFIRAIGDGDLPAKASAADLASYLAALMHGIAVQAAGGATRAQLLRVVKVAMENWPGAKRR